MRCMSRQLLRVQVLTSAPNDLLYIVAFYLGGERSRSWLLLLRYLPCPCRCG